MRSWLIRVTSGDLTGNVIPHDALEVVGVGKGMDVGLRVREGTGGKRMERKKMGMY